MPTEKFQNKYKIKTSRIPDWDYRSQGYYFIAICTHGKKHYFGAITGAQNSAFLLPTPIAHQNWLDIPKHFPFVELGEFVAMPDHVHGLLYFHAQNKNDFQKNSFGPQSKNLASVIRGYKSSVKSFATKNNIEFAWQSRYYNKVILNMNRAETIRKYIRNNPDKWLRDQMSKKNPLIIQ